MNLAVLKYSFYFGHYKLAVLFISVVDHLCLDASDQCRNYISEQPNPIKSHCMQLISGNVCLNVVGVTNNSKGREDLPKNPITEIKLGCC